MKSKEQMRIELKNIINSSEPLDYKAVEEKGIIKIIIVTEKYKEYQKRRIVRWKVMAQDWIDEVSNESDIDELELQREVSKKVN